VLKFLGWDLANRVLHEAKTSMLKVGMVSLGGPKNLVDSEVMPHILARQGYELTPQADEADVIIANASALIGPAKRESLGTTFDMAE
jgi:ribosomal protein S12 methylthiotransferase